MDQRTLLVSCVEYYSDLKAIPSDKVFAAFERAGFLKMILDSQQLFPEMGIDFYIGMVDGLTHLESDSSVGENTHHEERTALAAEVVSMLMKKHKMNDLEGCKLYYGSKTAGQVSEERTGFYKKAAQEIFDLIEAE
ncbi:MAG: hypothetical protein Q4C06_08090 [Bacillota bacterium]|nr:hypothetical protein [Bacillota bacterium]